MQFSGEWMLSRRLWGEVGRVFQRTPYDLIHYLKSCFALTAGQVSAEGLR
jgi:hypothetical protein